MMSLKSTLVVAASLAGAVSAHAVILFSQPSDTASSGQVLGSFSDALSSNGSYLYGQTIADNFTVGSGGWNVNTIRFWGGSEGFVFPDLSNFTDFEVNIMSPLGTVVQGGIVPKSSFTITPTGNATGTGLEYLFELTVNFSLAAGNYYLNVGSVNTSAVGDAFVWSFSNQGDTQYAFNFFDPNGWQSGQGANMSFEFEGTETNAVPEPFTMVLGIGAAGAYIRRRRRS